MEWIFNGLYFGIGLALSTLVIAAFAAVVTMITAIIASILDWLSKGKGQRK